MADHGQYLEKIVKAFKIIKKNISKYSSRERKEPDNLFCYVQYVTHSRDDLVLVKTQFLTTFTKENECHEKAFIEKTGIENVLVTFLF